MAITADDYSTVVEQLNRSMLISATLRNLLLCEIQLHDPTVDQATIQEWIEQELEHALTKHRLRDVL